MRSLSERFLVRISSNNSHYSNYVEKLHSNCTVFTDLGGLNHKSYLPTTTFNSLHHCSYFYSILSTLIFIYIYHNSICICKCLDVFREKFYVEYGFSYILCLYGYTFLYLHIFTHVNGYFFTNSNRCSSYIFVYLSLTMFVVVFSIAVDIYTYVTFMFLHLFIFTYIALLGNIFGIIFVCCCCIICC